MHVLHELLYLYYAKFVGRNKNMSASEFFDGSDNGKGLPMAYMIPAEEGETISQLHRMVNIEIDRSRSRANHLNKMMRTLMEHQKNLQEQTMASFKMLSAEIDEQMEKCQISAPLSPATPPQSPMTNSSEGKKSCSRTPASSSSGGDKTPTMLDPPTAADSDASTPPDPAFCNISGEYAEVESSTAEQPHDDPEVDISPERIAAALKARGIPDDLKVKFEVHPVKGPHLSVTRSVRLDGRAEERVQENLFKMAGGISLCMGWPHPIPITETFTGSGS